ncbi:hypothetical protein RHAB21_04488 [Pseudorhizobium halotolerans]|uniref:Uncharacterized protein n=1 Tax=Pseudorhizobium halotolerans TaxID=1233081 RepID=A0ABN7JXK2_9HYPH|nr:hypothetical protein RHAB21_04488 [Pseudorhizobium halotolerans]
MSAMPTRIPTRRTRDATGPVNAAPVHLRRAGRGFSRRRLTLELLRGRLYQSLAAAFERSSIMFRPVFQERALLELFKMLPDKSKILDDLREVLGYSLPAAGTYLTCL